MHMFINPCICFVTNIYLAFTVYKIILDDRNISGGKSKMVSDLMELNL